MTYYHPRVIEIIGAALALGGVIMWVVGMLILLKYAGTGKLTG